MGGEEETVAVHASSLIEKREGGGEGSEEDLMLQLSNPSNWSLFTWSGRCF